MGIEGGLDPEEEVDLTESHDVAGREELEEAVL